MDCARHRPDNRAMHQRITSPAALLADPTRAAIVLALMDGRAREAKKLALDAGVTPQTASAHLRKLVDADLLGAALLSAYQADGSLERAAESRRLRPALAVDAAGA